MAEFTEIEGRRFKQIDWGTQELPPCQAHLISRHLTGDDACTKPGEFDSPSLYGSWADLCIEHVAAFSQPMSRSGYHRIKKVPASVD